MNNKVLISHRGNTDGPNPEHENKPSRIEEVLDMNYYVEIDVQYIDGKFWLGHDEPQYEIDEEFLITKNLYCHAKTIEALVALKELADSYPGRYLIYFWHQDDDYTLTNMGDIWVYPGKPVLDNCIAVLPETIDNYDISKAIGICSDYIENYK